MASLDGIEATFAKWGIPCSVATVAGRPRSFAPAWVMAHHTAAGLANSSLHVVQNGRSGIPGPLCNVLVNRNDSVTIISRGSANHAGAGVWPGIPRDQGNDVAVGVEIENVGTGAEPFHMPFLVRVFAAICDHLGIPASRVVAHKEYAPTRKIDPFGWDMAAFRFSVASLLAHGPSASDDGGTTPDPTPEDDMADPQVLRLLTINANLTAAVFKVLNIMAENEKANSAALQAIRDQLATEGVDVTIVGVGSGSTPAQP